MEGTRDVGAPRVGELRHPPTCSALTRASTSLCVYRACITRVSKNQIFHRRSRLPFHWSFFSFFIPFLHFFSSENFHACCFTMGIFCENLIYFSTVWTRFICRTNRQFLVNFQPTLWTFHAQESNRLHRGSNCLEIL